MMQCLRRHLRLVSLSLLLVLAVQGLAATSLSTSSPPATGAENFPIVICTPAGMVVLPADYLFSDTDAGTDLNQTSPQHCIFCAASHAFAALMAFSLFFLPAASQPLPRPDMGQATHLPEAPDWLILPVRAPPLAS